jgi:acyl carrier protein
MLPSAFVVLDALPLTPNGKLDRKALPAPDAAGSAGHRANASTTPVEQELLRYIAETLGLEQVTPDADFFQIGGHSFLIPPLLAHIDAAYQVDIELLTFFMEPTVAHLARIVQATLDQRQQAQAAEEQIHSLLAHLSDAEVEMLLNDPSMLPRIS